MDRMAQVAQGWQASSWRFGTHGASTGTLMAAYCHHHIPSSEVHSSSTEKI